MNVLVLMAGDSQQFYDAGFKYPKPLIEINGEMIINRVIEQLQSLFKHGDKVIFMIRKDDNQKFHLANIIKLLVPEAVIVEVVGETAGAACTALLGIEYIDDHNPLLIINGDQLIDVDCLELLEKIHKTKCDAGTVVFQSVHPRWSYVKLDSNNNVLEAAEKKPISNNATAGFYYFEKGGEFIKFAQRMIFKDASTNNLFFVCPIFNEMILEQKKIVVTKIELTQYHSFMSPQLVNSYQKHLELLGNKK